MATAGGYGDLIKAIFSLQRTIQEFNEKNRDINIDISTGGEKPVASATPGSRVHVETHGERGEGTGTARGPSGLGSAGLLIGLGRIMGSLSLATKAMQIAAETVGHAHQNVRQYGAYSALGVQAKVNQNMGDLMRNIYISNKTGQSMLQFTEQENRMKNAWAPIKAAMENGWNKLGTQIAGLTAGLLEKINGPAKGKSLEELNPAFAKQLKAQREQIMALGGQIADAAQRKSELEQIWGDILIQNNGIAGEKEKARADVDEAERRVKVLQSDQEKAANKLDEMEKKAREITEKSQKEDTPADSMKAWRNQWNKQISALPRFGAMPNAAEDPRARQMRDDFVRRQREGIRNRMPGIFGWPEWMRGGGGGPNFRLPPGMGGAQPFGGGAGRANAGDLGVMGGGAAAAVARMMGKSGGADTRREIMDHRRALAEQKLHAENERDRLNKARGIGANLRDFTDAEQKKYTELNQKIRDYQDQIRKDNQRLKGMSSTGRRPARNNAAFFLQPGGVGNRILFA